MFRHCTIKARLFSASDRTIFRMFSRSSHLLQSQSRCLVWGDEKAFSFPKLPNLLNLSLFMKSLIIEAQVGHRTDSSVYHGRLRPPMDSILWPTNIPSMIYIMNQFPSKWLAISCLQIAICHHDPDPSRAFSQGSQGHRALL